MSQFSPICVTKSLFYLEGHFQNPQINLREVAAHAGYSPGHLSRQLRKYVGRGFRDLLLNLRIRAAKALLQEPAGSVKSVAFDVGYSHPSAFTRDFGRIVGMPPSRWRALVFDPARGESRFEDAGAPATRRRFLQEIDLAAIAIKNVPGVPR